MKDPSILLKTYLEERVCVRLKDSQFIYGKLHGFDEHLNIILSGIKEENDKLLFIRGENISFVGQE